MATIRQIERRLAVVTSWSLFGGFGLALIQSGMAHAAIPIGLAGCALLVAGFVAQVIVNAVYGGGFTAGEVAFGFAVFGVAVVGFVASWILDPAYGAAQVTIGLTGIAAMIVAFLVYLVTRYGLKGSFSMFHATGDRR
jgi:hypothetical protein